MNLADIGVLLLVAGAVALAVKLTLKQKKTGCTGCCASCACACNQRVREQ